MKTALLALTLSLAAGCSTVTVNVITAPAPKAIPVGRVPPGVALQAALDDDTVGMVWCSSDGTVCGHRR